MPNGYLNAQTQDRANQSKICTTRRREFRPKPENQSPLAVQLEQSPQAAHSQLARNEDVTVLNNIETVLRRFVWLPNERDYTILTLWIAYTHVYDLFDHAPRIALHSPVPGCGKSTLFRILDGVVRLGKIWTNPTEATLFRVMAKDHPTILFDEMDKYLHSNKAVLAVLNSGHMKGPTVPRTFDWDGAEAGVAEFDVFGPVAFALKAVQLPPDLAERSFRIDMQKAPKQLAKLTVQDLAKLSSLNERIKEFVQRNRERIETCSKQLKLPEAIINRAGDNWVPLFAMANAVGGEWLQRVHTAALEYEKHNPTQDRGMLLLSNLRTIVEGASKTFFSSQDLCITLNSREDWPWGEYAYGDRLSPHKLAGMLKGFGIKPRQERADGTGKVRGYNRRDLEKVWQAYGIQGEQSTE